MADQITDGRTAVDAAEATTNWDDIAGVGAGTLDSEIFIQGSNSISEIITSTRLGLLFDAGSAQDWSNNHFYIWINCGIVGLLDTKALGGFTIRFCGATVTDWFEFNVGGGLPGEWPTSISGGWTQFVVDIEATPSSTNGTPPATSAIRYVGFTAVTASVMPKHAANTWIDEIRRLPDGSPGIIVEGRDGGSTDWDFSDIAAQLGTGVGTFVQSAGGSWVCRAPIQWGINDTSTHGFTDTNQIVLFDDQEFIATDFYDLSALGNSGGTTNLTLGVKTGTGDDATGAQGVIFAAAAGGVRFSLDFNDPDLDGINFYGCSLIHGGVMVLDDAAVSFISTSFIDCTSALVSNSEMLRVQVIDADTADAVPFMTTDDLGDIVFSTFEFSDGHAVELTTPRVATQASKGNVFTGYGIDTSNDAAVFNDSGGAVTINVSEGGSGTTFRNGSGASTTVVNTVTLKVTVKDESGVAIQDAQVGIFQDSDNTQLMNEDTTSLGVAEEGFNYISDTAVSVRVRKNSPAATVYFPVNTPQTIISTGLTLGVRLIQDPISSN